MITAFGGKQMEKVRKKSIVHVHTYIVDGFWVWKGREALPFS